MVRTAARRTARGAWLLLGVAFPATASVRFEARTDLPGTNAQPAAVVAADFYGADGALDLAVSYYGSDVLVFYRNDGTGTLTSQDVLAAPPDPDTFNDSRMGAGPRGLVAADFNGDTLPDIAGCAEQAAHFFAYLNRTDVGMGWQVSDPDARRGNAAVAIAATQWNPVVDVSNDIVFAFSNGSVGIALGLIDAGLVPTGEFAQINRFSSSVVSGLTDVDVADFDPATTTLDVLTPDRDGRQLVVWRGDPVLPGSIQVDLVTSQPLLTRIPTEVGGQPVRPVQCVVDDWNGDSLADALVLAEEGYVLFYRGTGTAAIFQPPTVIDLVGPRAATRLPSLNTSMDYADLDGDGIRDLVVADAGDQASNAGFNWVSTYKGCAESPEPAFDLSGTTCGASPEHHAAGDLAPQRPGSLVAADLSGDGFADVLALHGDSRSRWSSYFRNRGDGTLIGARSFAAGGKSPVGAGAYDFNGDGRDDVAVSLAPDGMDASEHGVAVLRGNADGTLGFGAFQASSGLLRPQGLSIANVDGDSLPDILCDHGGDTATWPGNGNGTFDAPVLGGGAGGAHRLGNLSGSPSPDLASLDVFLARLRTWQNDGDATFTVQQTFTNLFGYADHVVAPFFGASRDDIVVSALSSDQFDAGAALFLVPYNSGAGNHGPMTQITLPPAFSGPFTPAFSRLAAASFTGSGRLDLVAITPGGNVLMFVNDGAQLVFDPALSAATVDPGPVSASAADLDGDGSLELVVASSDRVAVLPGAGGGAFGSPVVLPANLTNSSLALGDVDGDSLVDIAVSSTRTSDVTVFRNLSSASMVLRVRRMAGSDQSTAWWADQGAGATYDIVRGDLRDLLRVDRDTSAAACLPGGDDFVVPQFDDAAPLPARFPGPPLGDAWAGYYYLARCAGGECSEPTYGTDSLGVPHLLPLACP